MALTAFIAAARSFADVFACLNAASNRVCDFSASNAAFANDTVATAATPTPAANASPATLPADAIFDPNDDADDDACPNVFWSREASPTISTSNFRAVYITPPSPSS